MATAAERRDLARLREAYRTAGPGYRLAALHRLRTRLHEVLRNELAPGPTIGRRLATLDCRGGQPARGGDQHGQGRPQGRRQAGLLMQLDLPI